MIGVARQAALAHQRETEHYRDRPLGILDEPECQRLLEVLDRLQETEDRLFHFVKVRIDLESEREKRMALEKLQQINNEDEEAQQSQTLNY